MAFRFKLSEPFEEGFKRIAIDQIDRAQGLLKESPDRVVAVHETRKSLKRLRALLRLVRPALGEHAFQNENSQLREIGRILSGTRDRHVLMETVAKLEAASSLSDKSFADPIRQLLQVSNGGDAPTIEAAAMKQALALLGEAKKRLARLRLIGRGFAVVGPGLERSYRKARRAFRDAYLQQTDEAFHEWRKGTQQHWRHMALLVRAWPECLGARTSAARALSQLLGDDHDLSLLIAFLDSRVAQDMGAERIALAKKHARQRQEELRAIARPMGERLFVEGAKSLHRRIAAYWEAAVALAEHGRDEEEPPAPKKDERPPPKRRRVAARA